MATRLVLRRLVSERAEGRGRNHSRQVPVGVDPFPPTTGNGLNGISTTLAARLSSRTDRHPGGTALTAEFAEKHDRLCLVLDLATEPSADAVRGWIEQHRIRTVNVAVQQESNQPGIYELAMVVLRRLLADFGPKLPGVSGISFD